MSPSEARTLLLQIPSTAETAAVRQATFLAESSAFFVRNADDVSLAALAETLRQGALPVGSVEFVRRAMSFAGIAEPQNRSYPQQLQPWLHREVKTVRLDQVRERAFIKPATTKLFTGFVFDPDAVPDPINRHDCEQDQVARGLPGETLVYTSEVVEFLSEWRYYVQDGAILGGARYDAAGADDAPRPSKQVLEACTEAMRGERPFALDVGVLADGRTAVVEVNDGWAIGLYKGAITPAQYLSFLISCWDSIRATNSASQALLQVEQQ